MYLNLKIFFLCNAASVLTITHCSSVQLLVQRESYRNTATLIRQIREAMLWKDHNLSPIRLLSCGQTRHANHLISTAKGRKKAFLVLASLKRETTGFQTAFLNPSFSINLVWISSYFDFFVNHKLYAYINSMLLMLILICIRILQSPCHNSHKLITIMQVKFINLYVLFRVNGSET